MRSTSFTLLTAILVYYSAIVSAKTYEENKILRVPISRRSSNNNQQQQNRKLKQRDTTTSSASLYNANGKEYLIQVGVGSPPQYFNVTLDTGSADFWIPSSACPVAMCPHARFNAQKSTTFESMPQQLMIEYGIGTAKGSYGADTVTLGSASLANQTIGLVSNTNNILSANDQDQSNGILGIGYPGLSMKGGSKPGNFIMGLYQSKVISQPIFSIFLNSQFSYGNSGEIVLGGTDASKYTGDIQYIPVVTYDTSQFTVSPMVGARNSSASKKSEYLYWAIPGQGVSTSTGYKSNATLQAYILDTGTTLTYVPEAVAKSIVTSVTSNAKTTEFDAINGVYNIDCSLYKKTDMSVQFMISTSTSVMSTTPITISVPVSELVVPLDDVLTPDKSAACMFGIAPAPAGLGLTAGETWILGEATLRSLYAVYDLQQNRVGLANLAAGASVTNSSSVALSSSSDSSSVDGGNGTGAPAKTSSLPSSAGAVSKSFSPRLVIPSSSLLMSVLLIMFMSYYL